MNSFFFIILAILPMLAQAQNLSVGQNTSIGQNPNSQYYSIEVQGATAIQIYDYLQVSETPTWEDVNSMNKSAAGIYGYSAGQGQNRIAIVDFQLDPNSGLLYLSSSKDYSQLLNVHIDGAAGEKLYNLLKVQEQSLDPEFYDFQKFATGLSCSKTRAVGVDCILSINPKIGVLK